MDYDDVLIILNIQMLVKLVIRCFFYQLRDWILVNQYVELQFVKYNSIRFW